LAGTCARPLESASGPIEMVGTAEFKGPPIREILEQLAELGQLLEING
jgi:hypothetical protein